MQQVEHSGMIDWMRTARVLITQNARPAGYYGGQSATVIARAHNGRQSAQAIVPLHFVYADSVSVINPLQPIRST